MMLQLKVWYSGVFVVLPVRAATSVQDVKSNFEVRTVRILVHCKFSDSVFSTAENLSARAW